MKTSIFSVLTIATILSTACSNYDTMQNDKEQDFDIKGLTEFAVGDNNATRTSGEYTGTGIKFYWTEGDELWIADGGLTKSIKSDITGKTETAKFYFTGTYTANSYPVRYTGGNAGDKVTIKAIQKQEQPNDGSHIGKDGDCGTGTATKSGGRYKFRLSHKASYITFVPYYSHGFAEDVKVTQIKVTADKAIAGTYNFDDTGLQTSTATNISKRITLILKNGNDDGFEIPKSETVYKNAAIMVLSPGTYNDFTVEYTLYDQKTHVKGTVTKNYGTRTFNVGKNKKVAYDLAVPHYGQEYYLWDAINHCWKGHETGQPKFNNESNKAEYPKSADIDRWFNDNVGYPESASRSCKDCPNVNEMHWYVKNGDPHWDGTTIWETMGHLYQGGVWFKKKSKIAGFSSTQAPDNKDYTTNSEEAEINNNSVKKGKPTVSSNYFYLPTLGCYSSGGALLYVGVYGEYWSKTPSHKESKYQRFSYYLALGENSVGVSSEDRFKAFKVWTAQ